MEIIRIPAERIMIGDRIGGRMVEDMWRDTDETVVVEFIYNERIMYHRDYVIEVGRC